MGLLASLNWPSDLSPTFEPTLERLDLALEQNASTAELAELSQLLTDANDPSAAVQFKLVVQGSEFASQYLSTHPALLLNLIRTSRFNRLQEATLISDLSTADDLPLQVWEKHIRHVRHSAMCGIIWRDFNRLVPLETTLEDLSLLAATLLQTTLDKHTALLHKELGTPTDAQGNAQPLLILGMGKLGGWELNLSSDVDLIFAYPKRGETKGGSRTVSNEQFFTQLGQRIIKSLDQTTAEGFVFRVDMRLRPYGQSGALACNFDALEDYYHTQGRDWERFAMIKARVVASTGSPAHTQQLMDILHSFAYRRYVDFSAIESLRQLKALINKEVARKPLKNNIKLGKGGIREIEFIAQAFQLVRGGKDTELQERRVLKVLPALEKLNCLPEGVADNLCEAYRFLRNVEHAIQGFQDKQSQNLPTDDTGLLRIAKVMGFDDITAFKQALKHHTGTVHEQFNLVIADPDKQQSDAPKKGLETWKSIWLFAQRKDEATREQLDQLGFDDSSKAQALLFELASCPPVAAMDRTGRNRLDEFMPQLLERIHRSDTPTETLARLVNLITAIARRSAYLVLLLENPMALEQLILLSEASPWIANRLAEYPALLDELLDASVLYFVPEKAELADELRRDTLRIDTEDLEQQMDALRYFKNAHSLRVAACEVTGRLPLMKVSDYLTELAEVILDYVLQLAWQQMCAKHGAPSSCDNPSHADMLIVGYGKLGGIEFAHESDLDLVFIHDTDPNGQTVPNSDDQKPLDNLTFYTRLGQKIIHFLSTQMGSGRLYEVDMRLRPSGASGPLVSSLSAFEKYQTDSAWTWEHQALVRARPIAGPTPMRDAFSRIREQTLVKERDAAALKKDVVDMRLKMRQQLGTRPKQQAEPRFHLKQDAGGIVDIEFMVQYAVLLWAHSYPALTRYTDNIRILSCIEASGKLSTQEVVQLTDAYKAFRSYGHKLALQQQSNVIPGDLFSIERNYVSSLWAKLMST